MITRFALLPHEDPSVPPVERFFSYCRERHAIHLRRKRGDPFPWTTDPILQKYRFCQVERELDRHTIYLREHIRDPMRGSPNVLLSVVLARWFNRISTWEVVFCEPDLWGKTLWDKFLASGDEKELEAGIRKAIPKGPWVTGAYFAPTPYGLDKLAGICASAGKFYRGEYEWPYNFDATNSVGWRTVGEHLLRKRGEVTLRETWQWLKQASFQGPFNAYEVVTDLSHTDLLDKAPDIMTWANAGPGAQRGLNRLSGREVKKAVPEAQAQAEMQELLALSRVEGYWPQNAEYNRWTMRTAEHNLCEMDKLLRTLAGEGRPRGVFKP